MCIKSQSPTLHGPGTQLNRQARLAWRGRIAPALLCIFLLACRPPVSELFHQAELKVEPDLKCILVQLRTVADEATVQEITDTTPSGIHHRFNFRVGAVHHGLGISVREHGSFVFRHQAGAPKPNLKQLLGIRQSMVAVEKTLSGQCGLGNFTPEIQESCMGPHCDRLLRTRHERPG